MDRRRHRFADIMGNRRVTSYRIHIKQVERLTPGLRQVGTWALTDPLMSAPTSTFRSASLC
jgi:hypothetical protein